MLDSGTSAALGERPCLGGHLTALVSLSDVRKVAAISRVEADSCPEGLADLADFAPTVGVEVVYQAQVSLAQPDYTAEVLQARSRGAEAIVIIMDTPSTIRIIRSAHRQGWSPQLVGGPAVFTDEFLEGGEAVDGAIVFSTTRPFNISPAMQEYRDSVAAYVPGGRTGDFGANIWVAGKLWERIAPALAAPTITRKQIFDALHALEDETLGALTPPLNFPATRTQTTHNCLIPLQVRGGEYTTPIGEEWVCNPR